jgi:HlyD family secretion protein
MKKTFVVIGAVAIVIVGFSMLKAATGGKPDVAKAARTATVTRDDLTVTAVETGTIDALKTVEVKPQVSGRLKVLYVQEGDTVKQGQLVAIIDPQETQLRVQQDSANLQGAQSVVQKTELQIVQTRQQDQAAYDQAKVRVAQLELQMKAQPELTKASIDGAQTSLTTAIEARRQLLESTHPTARTSAVSAVREAQANYDNAVQDNDRQQGLLNKGYVPAKTAESSALTLNLARVRLDQAKDNLAKLDAQIRAEAAKADEAVKQAQAELSTARANSILDQTKRQDYLSALSDLAKAKAALQDPAIMEQGKLQSQAAVMQLAAALGDSQRQLRETDVRAPIDGIVTKKELEVGELATGLSTFSSGTPIVRIEDRRGMRVKLDVNEIDVAKMTVGMDATVDVDALPQHAFHGVVTRIAPASSSSSADSAASSQSADAVVKYEVEIRLKDGDSHLRSGMSARCTLQVIHRSQTLLLPIEFVSKEPGGAFVDVVVKGAAPARRQIVVGAESGSMIEVLSGLKEGDVVQLPAFKGPARKGAMQFGNDDQ